MQNVPQLLHSSLDYFIKKSNFLTVPLMKCYKVSKNSIKSIKVSTHLNVPVTYLQTLTILGLIYMFSYTTNIDCFVAS